VLMLHRLVVATDRIEIDGAHANEDLIPERRRSDEDGFDTRMAVDEGDEKRMIPRADAAIIVVCYVDGSIEHHRHQTATATHVIISRA
jgi:hypothetical protein